MKIDCNHQEHVASLPVLKPKNQKGLDIVHVVDTRSLKNARNNNGNRRMLSFVK